MKDKTHAWYALRRTLPPWRFDENLRELEEYVVSHCIDEVVVKVDTEEFWHGQPRVSWVEGYVPKLLELKQRMAEVGVAYSLNPWTTLGHGDRGRDDREALPGFQGLVDHNGVEACACACPLNEAWRKNIREVWTLYAATKPKVLWIEDDIRTFNHRPVMYSCFCPLHLERFARRVGQAVTRELLVAAIFQKGEPHPWRGEYMDMQSEVMNDTIAYLAEVVHAVSPETSLGLMSSGPRAHCLEGREWAKFAENLADGAPLYSRPPMGNYWEGNLRGLYYSQDSIKVARHCLPTGTVEQTEVENWPYTRYSKSVNFTFLEMAVSFAYGSHGVTLNLYDHSGTPMADEPWYGKLLLAKKPFLESLAVEASQSGAFRGVRLLHHDRGSYQKRLTRTDDFIELIADGAPMMELLEAMGVPTTFDASSVVAVCGEQLRPFSDEEIQDLLRQNILLDGKAAAVLVERGFGPENGLKAISGPCFLDDLAPLSAEEFYNADFGGAEKCFLTLTLPTIADRPDIFTAELVCEAVVISSLVDADLERQQVGMYAYENTLGGRVVTHLLDLASSFGIAFMHPHRMRQIQGVMQWLFRGAPPMIVKGAVYPMAFRKDYGTRSLLGFFNLTLDSCDEVQLECGESRRIQDITLLEGSEWRCSERLSIKVTTEKVSIRVMGPVRFEEPVFIRIHWSE